jgi:hypothetical protein
MVPDSPFKLVALGGFTSISLALLNPGRGTLMRELVKLPQITQMRFDILAIQASPLLLPLP